MQLVIDIPEEIYKASQIIDVKYEDVIQIHLEVIANGKVLEPCDDVISREQVLNAIIDFVTFEEYIDNSNHVTFIPLERRINTMSPVTPSGGWEEMTVPCENCGHDMTFKIAVCGESSRRRGHWIPIYQGDEIINYHCSECELGDTNGSINLYGWGYCRRCGAEMEEEE